MQDQINQVRDFHERMQISKTQRIRNDGFIRDTDTEHSEFFQSPDVFSWNDIQTLKAISNKLERLGKGDERLNRIHLHLEEAVIEFAIAMNKGCMTDDEEEWLDFEAEVLDAISDASYVVFGSAVAFDLPLANGFSEVHASNMTKEKQPTDPSAHRVRAKGPNYRPPNLKEIVRLHRIQT